MVYAYHLILSAYGFWLPNDPRGSWSDFVRAWELLKFGPATKVKTTESVAARRHDREARLHAKEFLAHRPVVFNGLQGRALARGFAKYVERSGVIIHAAAILPEHVHLVVARHRYEIETIANLIKGAATTSLIDEGLHPFADEPCPDGSLPTPWARKHWACYLDSESYIRNAIAYTLKNPVRAGHKAQNWNFVVPFTGLNRRW